MWVFDIVTLSPYSVCHLFYSPRENARLFMTGADFVCGNINKFESALKYNLILLFRQNEIKEQINENLCLMFPYITIRPLII